MNLKKVHPELVRRIQWVQEVAKSYGVKSCLTSGYRTYAQQKRLYEHPEGYPVSPPGCTSHELGLAVDLVSCSGSRGTDIWNEHQEFLMYLGNLAGLSTYPQDPIHFTLFNLVDLQKIKSKFCKP